MPVTTIIIQRTIKNIKVGWNDDEPIKQDDNDTLIHHLKHILMNTFKHTIPFTFNQVNFSHQLGINMAIPTISWTLIPF